MIKLFHYRKFLIGFAIIFILVCICGCTSTTIGGDSSSNDLKKSSDEVKENSLKVEVDSSSEYTSDIEKNENSSSQPAIDDLSSIDSQEDKTSSNIHETNTSLIKAQFQNLYKKAQVFKLRLRITIFCFWEQLMSDMNYTK